MTLPVPALRFRTLLLTIVAGLLTGCASYHLPEIPPAPRGSFSKLTLGIEHRRVDESQSDWRTLKPDQQLALEGKVVEALRQRGAFKEVGFVNELSTRPDVVVKNPRFGSGPYLFEPMLVVLTAGVIPQEFRTFCQADFELASADGHVLASVKRQHDDSGLMGWVALPLRLSSHWSANKPDSKILAERFAHDIEEAVGEQYQAAVGR